MNIALVQSGSPQLGVIYVPVKDAMYFAALGIGAWKLESAAALPEMASLDQIKKQANQLPLIFEAVPPHRSSRSHRRSSAADRMYPTNLKPSLKT